MCLVGSEPGLSSVLLRAFACVTAVVGVVGLGAEVGLFVPVWAFRVVFVGVVLTWLAASWVVARSWRRQQLRVLTRYRVVSALVLFGIAVGLVLQIRSNAGWLPVVPNGDALHFMNRFANISRFGSLSQSSIYGNVSGMNPAADSAFYPMGSHLLMTPLLSLWSSVYGVVSLVTVVMFAVIHPLGIFVMMRTFKLGYFGSSVAALAAVSIGMVPFGPLSWGGVPTLFGLVLLPFGIAWVNSSAPGPERDVSAVAMWSVRAAFVAAGLFVVHPSAGLLFVVYAGLYASIRRGWSGVVRVCGACVTVAVLTWPMVSALPGAGLLRRIGNVDPFFGDSLQQLAQIVSLSPNSPHRYWHALILIPVALLVLAGFRTIYLERDSTIVTWVNRLRVLAAFALVVVLLHVTLVFYLTDPTWSWTTWSTSLWYRQYARLAYQLVLIVAAAFGVVVDISIRRLSIVVAERDGGRSFASTLGHATIAAVPSVVLLLPVVAGLGTVGEHQREIWAIGPMIRSDVEATISAVSKVESESPFIVASFMSGASIVSLATGVPSSAEPYGRSPVDLNLAALLNAGAQHPDLYGYLAQWGSPVVLTNSSDPSGVLSSDLLRSGGSFRESVVSDRVSLWTLKSTAVTLGPLGPPRSDLYDGRALHSPPPEGFVVNFFNMNDATEVDAFVDVLKPACAVGDWQVRVTDAGGLDVDLVPIDDGIRVTMSGRVLEFGTLVSVVADSDGCVIGGDGAVTRALVAFPVVNE